MLGVVTACGPRDPSSDASVVDRIYPTIIICTDILGRRVIYRKVDSRGMAVRNRVLNRVTGLFVRWDLIEHPYGREYARERYSLTGRRMSDVEFESGPDRRHSWTRAALVGAALLLMSLLTAGILLAAV
jgi:hypothetical protein